MNLQYIAHMYNVFKSSKLTAYSGLQQGYNKLGSQLFISFINEVTSVIIFSNILLRADSTKISLSLKNIGE